MSQSWALERGEAGGASPLDFESFSKKGCFLVFEWEKTNFTTFGPPWKILEKPPSAPPWKNPSDAHGRNTTVCKFNRDRNFKVGIASRETIRVTPR